MGKYKETNHAYYVNHKEEIKEKIRNNPNNKYKKYYIKNSSERKKKARIRNLLLKWEALLQYSNGDMKCVLCGEDRTDCLSIDHINGGGNKHRKSIGVLAGISFYYWLRDNNYPKGYRTLCMNCQFIEMMKNKGGGKIW